MRRLYRSGSFTTIAKELGIYKLDLVDVHEVRWYTGGMVRAGDYIFLYGKGNKNHQFKTGFLIHHRRVSQVKRLELLEIRCHI